ncbi:MAG: peptide chain release factor N(5)-glutamine methyltransferase [Rhizobiales bacterium]|nr:peptide chain release factor N(5)-glutamine methyltransferase [Hyphomicrobiales bacterium]
MTLAAATPTLASTRQALAESFRKAGIDSAEADARLLIAHALGIDRSELIANGTRMLNAREMQAIDALAARRLKHEPVARILGTKEFWSLMLDVTPAVLVPRPDTETVVEAALDFVVRDGLRMQRLRILDIGTGSGALLLALLSELPDALGTGTDISTAALAVARGNAERHGLSSRCSFVACDIAAGLPGPFDLIVSNPPYVAHGDIATLAPEVRDYDPIIALDGGSDGLDGYRAIAADARRLLAPGGRLIVELGAGQEDAVRALLTKAGLTVDKARDDLGGIARALSVTVAP